MPTASLVPKVTDNAGGNRYPSVDPLPRRLGARWQSSHFCDRSDHGSSIIAATDGTPGGGGGLGNPRVVASRGGSDLDFSSSFSWWELLSSLRSSMSYDIGWHFTPAHSTEARICITTSGPASVPTSVRRPSLVRLASVSTPVSARSIATPRDVGGLAITRLDGTPYILCRHHHPDVPTKGASHEHILEQHRKYKEAMRADATGH